MIPVSGASDGPPVLETVTDSGGGAIGITWTNPNTPPMRFIGFAWDLYTADWVEMGTDDTMWYNISADSTSSTMDLGFSGGYFVWVSNQYQDYSWYPAENPDTFTLLSGTPHTPLNVTGSVPIVGDDDDDDDDDDDIALANTVTLQWEPDLYGTWLYWIIAYDAIAGEFVTIQGPQGSSQWQYVSRADAAFVSGSVNLTVPQTGLYWFFIGAMAWDAETLGEFAATDLVTVQ